MKTRYEIGKPEVLPDDVADLVMEAYGESQESRSEGESLAKEYERMLESEQYYDPAE